MQIVTHSERSPVGEDRGHCVSVATAVDHSIVTEVRRVDGDEFLKVSVWCRHTNECLEVICDYQIDQGFNHPKPRDFECVLGDTPVKLAKIFQMPS